MDQMTKKISRAVMMLYSIIMSWMCAMPVCAANGAAGSEQQIGLLVVLMGGALIIILAVVISVVSTVVSSVASAVEDEGED
ncbi:MAG: hypothetical protein J6N53_11470 [Lachnospiraceae bacterium]|nr:hypothetical protein [Lachnospiraceae bacterium]